jgi:phosphoribosylformylglycinamidine cyclo-ligase
VVEKSKMLSADKVQVGDVVLGLEASGLHSNGYSLVRKIVADRGLKYTDKVPEFERGLGEELLEPTRLYTGVLNQVLERYSGQISTMSHITGGGIAANLSRVLPQTVSLDVERASWSPNQVFRVLADWGGYDLKSLESTWNLGLGFAVVVRKDFAVEIQDMISGLGIPAWQLGIIESTACDAELPGYVSEAKGVRGGAVRLVGNYAE